MAVAQKKKNFSSREKGSLFLWFFLAALFLSLVLHVFFLKKAGSWKVRGFAPEEYDQIVPRTFRMKRVEIDPKTLEEPAPTPVRKKELPPVEIEKETPQPETRPEAAPKVSTLSKPTETLLQEKPVAVSQGLSDLLKNAKPDQAGETGRLPESPDHAPLIPVTMEKNLPASGTVAGGEGGTARFSSLDDLLAGGAPVNPATAPILMPTDLLFEYDSATLKPAAAESLAKLGTLIARNAGSTFRIEGHTDSFGSDAYNMDLSLRRAAEVKRWLQANMGIAEERITTAGLGKSRLLVPGTLSIAEQQMNRRVEIVITTPRP